MKEIRVSTQEEFDKIKRVEKDEYLIVESSLRLNCKLEVFGKLLFKFAVDCSFYDGRYVVALGNSSVEAWGNSSVVARGNSSVEARGNSSVEAWGNSSVVALGNSSVVALGNSSVEAWGNSSVEAWGNSSVEAWGNSSVEARGNSITRLYSAVAKIVLFGFSVCFKMENGSVSKKSKTATVITPKAKEGLNGWLDNNGIESADKVILFKKVSHDFKTQENTPNETLWEIGKTIVHPKWNPKVQECGEGKFHACSRPYFCDEFRSEKGDRYIAIEIFKRDLYAWPKPSYPNKIAFKKGKVLFECNRFGKEITAK